MQNYLKTWVFIFINTCLFSFNALSQNYCENGSNGNQLMWVESVYSGPFANDTGPFNNQYGDQDHLYIGYADYSIQVMDWQVGENPLTLVPGRFNHPIMAEYPSFWQVWLDINADQSFTQDERVFATSSFGVVDANIDLSGLELSNELITRMRISVSFYENMPSCGSIEHGEVEDYTVRIEPATNNTLLVPEQYPTIQSAVDVAEAGDRVLVNDGSYVESVVVDKALVIESVNGEQLTTVTATDGPHTFTIMSPEVTIKGFAIENLAVDSVADIYFGPGSDQGQAIENSCAAAEDTVADSAVYVNGANDIQVKGLVCLNTGLSGIHAKDVVGGLFEGNHISSQDDYGIFIDNGDSLIIENNTINENGRVGIFVSESVDILVNNNSSNNHAQYIPGSLHGHGIYVSRSEGIVISANEIENNRDKGIAIYLSDQIDVLDNYTSENGSGIGSDANSRIDIHNNVSNQNRNYGLVMTLTDFFSIKDNVLNNNNQFGLIILRSHQGSIEKNQMLDNLRDLSLGFSSNNEFIANHMEAREVTFPGLCIVDIIQSNNNRFLINNFLMPNNELCSDQVSTNYWRSQTQLNYLYQGQSFQDYLGNYYSAGNHSDVNNDGIADNAFQLPGNAQYDLNPLVNLADQYMVQF